MTARTDHGRAVPTTGHGPSSSTLQTRRLQITVVRNPLRWRRPEPVSVWIYEGPKATAPEIADATVAVSDWHVYIFPRNLEAVLAHKVAATPAAPISSERRVLFVPKSA
jgi:hypothetical protein